MDAGRDEPELQLRACEGVGADCRPQEAHLRDPGCPGVSGERPRQLKSERVRCRCCWKRCMRSRSSCTSSMSTFVTRSASRWEDHGM
eukprot:673391-Hanusia_phi.AAC.2